MDNQIAYWELFQLTGSIDFYLKYKSNETEAIDSYLTDYDGNEREGVFVEHM